MLTDESIADFQKLYKQHFGKEISKQEALEQGMSLIQLMKVILKPQVDQKICINLDKNKPTLSDK